MATAIGWRVIPREVRSRGEIAFSVERVFADGSLTGQRVVADTAQGALEAVLEPGDQPVRYSTLTGEICFAPLDPERYPTGSVATINLGADPRTRED